MPLLKPTTQQVQYSEQTTHVFSRRRHIAYKEPSDTATILEILLCSSPNVDETNSTPFFNHLVMRSCKNQRVLVVVQDASYGSCARFDIQHSFWDEKRWPTPFLDLWRSPPQHCLSGPPRPICPHTHTSFYASCLTSVLERKTVVRSACSHAAQSFNIRPIWRDSSNTSLLVCQSTDRCCPQSPTFQSTSIFQLLRCPSSSIHHRGSLTLRGWYGCIDLTKTHADRSSLFWVTRCLVCTVNETKCIINASHQSSDVEVPCCSRNTLNLVTPTKIYPVQQHETKVIHSAKIAHVDCSSPN